MDYDKFLLFIDEKYKPNAMYRTSRDSIDLLIHCLDESCRDLVFNRILINYHIDRVLHNTYNSYINKLAISSSLKDQYQIPEPHGHITNTLPNYELFSKDSKFVEIVNNIYISLFKKDLNIRSLSKKIKLIVVCIIHYLNCKNSPSICYISDDMLYQYSDYLDIVSANTMPLMSVDNISIRSNMTMAISNEQEMFYKNIIYNNERIIEEQHNIISSTKQELEKNQIKTGEVIAKYNNLVQSYEKIRQAYEDIKSELLTR